MRSPQRIAKHPPVGRLVPSVWTAVYLVGSVVRSSPNHSIDRLLSVPSACISAIISLTLSTKLVISREAFLSKATARFSENTGLPTL